MCIESIDDGICLEKSGKTLYWGLSSDELIAMYRCKVEVDKYNGKQLLIERESIFGGMEVSLSTKLFPNQKLKKLEIYTNNSKTNESALEHFKRISQEINSVIGEPLDALNGDLRIDLDWDLPCSSWKLKKCTISFGVYDRFGYYTRLTIERKGKISNNKFG